MDLNLNNVFIDKSALRQAQATWLLGLLSPEDIVSFAESALLKGIESNVVLELAALSASDSDNVRRVFSNFLAEQGCKTIAVEEALKEYASGICKLIIQEKIPPLDGAELIWRAQLKSRIKGFHELDPFIYAASEKDERPNDKEFFEKAVKEEAIVWANDNYN